ncbi:MAG: FG-GAP-like repeat-containing protein [bacterium]|nr:FG-GAP-like repeat-containing protein [bacterium]
MKSLILILLCLPVLLYAQDFQFHQEYDSVQLQIGDYTLPAAWTGGYDYSTPAVCDIDADGDLDLFLGCSDGTVSYWLNTGNSQTPAWTLMSQKFQDIDVSSHSGPILKDLDADDDFDLIIESGALQTYLYRNIGTAINPSFILWEDTLKDQNGQPIEGTYGDFVDIDADGDLDFFTGTWYSGYVQFYRNIGSAQQYALNLENPNVLGVAIGNWTRLKFCDIDNDGDYDLFIGDHTGHVRFYRNEGTPQQFNFVLDTNQFSGINVGADAAPCFCDLDGDGDFDLLLGKSNEYSYDIPGAMQYWENIGTPQICNFVQVNQNYLTFDAGNSCEPDLCDIDSDEDLDLFFSTNAQLGWMRNNGTPQNPDFEIRTFNLMELSPGSCQFTNLDGDAIPDLITAGGWSGLITYYHTRFNNGNPEFVEIGEMDTPYSLYQMTLGDVDDDGADEMVLGGFLSYPSSPVLAYYENSGTPGHPSFTFVTDNWQNLVDSMMWLFSEIIPYLVDVDNDSDLDLLMVNYLTNTIFLYTNIGTPQNPYFTLTNQNFLNQNNVEESYLGYGDIDADGDMDIFTGHYQGGIKFFRNVTGDSTAVLQPTKMRPRPCRATLTIGPNPSNPITAISYQLSAVSLVNLSVYDISGRRVAQLVNSRQNPGEYSVSWNATGNASGVYLVRLDAGKQRVTGKVVVVK